MRFIGVLTFVERHFRNIHGLLNFLPLFYPGFIFQFNNPIVIGVIIGLRVQYFHRIFKTTLYSRHRLLNTIICKVIKHQVPLTVFIHIAELLPGIHKREAPRRQHFRILHKLIITHFLIFIFIHSVKHIKILKILP